LCTLNYVAVKFYSDPFSGFFSPYVWSCAPPVYSAISSFLAEHYYVTFALWHGPSVCLSSVCDVVAETSTFRQHYWPSNSLETRTRHHKAFLHHLGTGSHLPKTTLGLKLAGLGYTSIQKILEPLLISATENFEKELYIRTYVSANRRECIRVSHLLVSRT